MRTATTTKTLRHERDARETTRKESKVVVLSSAELAECTCPEWCDRDHDRD
jgi:hypothetical protein